MCLISFEGQAQQKPPNEGSLKATWSMEELLGWPCVSATVPSQRKYRHSEIKKGTKGTGLAPFYDLLLLFFFFFGCSWFFMIQRLVFGLPFYSH